MEDKIMEDKIMGDTTAKDTTTEKPTMEEQIEYISLKLKQLTALKVIEAVHEGYGLFYAECDDDSEDYTSYDKEEHYNRRALFHYKEEFREATEELDEMYYCGDYDNALPDF